MSTESPQLAFTQWLANAIDCLCEAIRSDERAVKLGRPMNLFW